jgi:hypothetical protein
MSETFRFATSDTRRPRAVGDAERGLVLEARRRFEEPRRLFLAQHDRRLARLANNPERANEVGPFERHGEKEPQRGDRGVDRACADLPLRHMQLIAAKVLARRRIRRPAEEGCELPHTANVVPLRVFAEPARRDVVDQALTQRADGLLGHGKLLSRMGWNPTIGPGPDVPAYRSRALSARSPQLPRERFSRVPGMFSSLEVKVLYPT